MPQHYLLIVHNNILQAVKDLTNTTRYRILDEKAVQTSLLTTTSPKRRQTDQAPVTDHSEDESTLVTPTPITALPTRYAHMITCSVTFYLLAHVYE